MRRSRVITALVAAGTLAFGAGMAVAAPGSTTAESSKAPAATATTPVAKTPAVKMEAVVRSAEGVVTHVEPKAVPPALVMKTQEGTRELLVGVDVPATTIIREGKSVKTLQDLKSGDRVWMRWTRQETRLVADAIHILPAHSTAASKAAPAVAKTGMARKGE